jgi:hypothetical protein
MALPTAVRPRARRSAPVIGATAAALAVVALSAAGCGDDSPDSVPVSGERETTTTVATTGGAGVATTTGPVTTAAPGG